MNTPNKLTIARVIMIPFFVAFLMYDITGAADKWIALVIFVVASLTDTLDGYLARKHNLVNEFWKIYGPPGGQASGMFCSDLLYCNGKTGGLDYHCDHCQRIYYQWIPPCCGR